MKFTSLCISLILCAFAFSNASCNNHSTASALIFERKHIDSNKLRVIYKYVVEGKGYIDSAIIKNTVLNSDSITVTFNKNTPEKSSFKGQKD